MSLKVREERVEGEVGRRRDSGGEGEQKRDTREEQRHERREKREVMRRTVRMVNTMREM